MRSAWSIGRSDDPYSVGRDATLAEMADIIMASAYQMTGHRTANPLVTRLERIRDALMDGDKDVAAALCWPSLWHADLKEMGFDKDHWITQQISGEMHVLSETIKGDLAYRWQAAVERRTGDEKSMEFGTRIAKIGNCHYIRIPKYLMDVNHYKRDDEISVRVTRPSANEPQDREDTHEE